MDMRKVYALSAFLVLFFSAAQAQLGGTHNYLDSSYIAPRDLAQQQDFLNNNSNFPAKPRDMWQLGVFAGFPYVDGDCPAAFQGAGKGLSSKAWGVGASLRKAIGYVVSVRGSLAYYNMVGLDYQRNRNFNNFDDGSTTPRNLLTQRYLNSGQRGYFHNFNTKAIVPSLEALVSLNNIMFHNRQGRFNIYALVGYTAFLYQTKMDVLADNNAIPNWDQIDVTKPRKNIRTQLRKLMDGNYETTVIANDRRPQFGKYNLRHSFSTGFGMEYRVAKMTSVGIEYKRIQTRDDYVDGWYRQSGDIANPVFTSEWDNVGFLNVSVNQNLGNSSKRIPPLWWMNPLEFAYSELNNPKHMKLPKVKLDDADGDGVTDQFDLEPNTPPGAPVDTHGVSKDTDGDGVPDYRDKELITLQNCFPVDEDGVGNCPEPECCKEIRKCCDSNKVNPSECKITDLPSIQFKGSTVRLSKEAKELLNSVADKLKAQPACKVKLTGHGAPNKREQQLSWDRVNAIKSYLVLEKGISASRIIFEYGSQGDVNTVDMMGTTEDGPNTVPMPHPNLQTKR